jgi:hypothetical protein
MATRPLFKLGKTEEALALLEKADQSPGSDVVSHRLNLAMAYTILGRPQDAMDRLDDWSEKDGSKFGNIFAQDIRACASAQLGATAVVEEALSYIEAHVPEGPDTVVEALSCVGDLERLKKAILAGLDNPSTRNDFLRILQDYREPPHVTAKEREIADNLQSMRDDRDIISAVAKYGTIRSWPAYTALF